MPRLARLKITAEPVAGLTDVGFDYLLKWSSRRRSLSIEVDANQVVVRAPHAVAKSYVHKFVVSRREWVLEKLEQQARRQSEVPVREYAEGGVFTWLGQDYPLLVSRGPKTHIRIEGQALEDQRLCVTLAPRTQLKTQLLQWYRLQAEQMLWDKTHFYAEQLGVSITGVNFRLTKTKWGHCTRSGQIQYNWHIVLAPEAVVNYLVAHEVSHRRHMNHGSAFWRTVEKLCPDFELQRQWLKRFGHTLVL